MSEERRMKNALKRVSSDMEKQESREYNKRRKGPSIPPPDSSLWVCNNPACRATQSTTPRFCKSCSCYICYRFDNSMDPTLWLKCSPDDSGCGFLCHVECALRHGRVHLDGCYSCAFCSNLSSIIGCWKEQLKIALDSNRVDALRYRISLSYRLLNGTSKFRELHTFVEDLKAKLEMEVGPINLTTGRMSRPYGGRFRAATQVQALCRLAIKKAEELLSPRVIQLGSCSRSRVADVQHETSTLEQGGLLLPDLNEEYCEADTKPNTAPPSTSSGSGGLDDAFESIVKTMCVLEHNSFVTEQFRMKFLTWFSIKAEEHERRIVRMFVQTLIHDSRRLAEQLIDTFSTKIYCRYCSKP